MKKMISTMTVLNLKDKKLVSLKISNVPNGNVIYVCILVPIELFFFTLNCLGWELRQLIGINQIV